MLSSAPYPEVLLSAAITARGIRLRPEADADEAFLIRLYASTREREIALMVRWSAVQKNEFIAQQFAAQRADYRKRIPCSFSVIEHDGDAIGRLYVAERMTQWHVIDIALLPEWRGVGIGTALLEAVIATARAQDRGVGIFVDRDNVALRLYRRLGFEVIGETAFHIEMECGTASRADPLS